MCGNVYDGVADSEVCGFTKNIYVCIYIYIAKVTYQESIVCYAFAKTKKQNTFRAQVICVLVKFWTLQLFGIPGHSYAHTVGLDCN